MNVLFCENQLGIRGTTVAVYDYAHYNEVLLGNTSYVAAPANSDLTTLDKFRSRFGDRVILHDNLESSIPKDIDVAYVIKAGFDDGKLVPGVKNIVHAVFDASHKHGDIYVAVSKWLGDKHGVDYLPHMVNLPDIKDDFREFLGLSPDDLVIGRYGGYDQFDVPYLSDVIMALVERGHKFLFMNTKQLTYSHPNIIYVDPTYDLPSKAAFINTCDVMLHGRMEGESFGLSVCEFLSKDKPVFTNIECRDKNHIHILGDKGFYYSSPNELFVMLASYKKEPYNMKHLVEEFTPEAVMTKFKSLIDG